MNILAQTKPAALSTTATNWQKSYCTWHKVEI